MFRLICNAHSLCVGEVVVCIQLYQLKVWNQLSKDQTGFACSTSMFSSSLHVKFVMDFVEELQLGLNTYCILTVKAQLN